MVWLVRELLFHIIINPKFFSADQAIQCMRNKLNILKRSWSAKVNRKTHWIAIITQKKIYDHPVWNSFFECLLCRFFSIFLFGHTNPNYVVFSKRNVLHICYVLCWMCLCICSDWQWRKVQHLKMKWGQSWKLSNYRESALYLKVHGTECLYNIKKMTKFIHITKTSSWMQWVNFPKIKCFGISATAKKRRKMTEFSWGIKLHFNEVKLGQAMNQMIKICWSML